MNSKDRTELVATLHIKPDFRIGYNEYPSEDADLAEQGHTAFTCIYFTAPYTRTLSLFLPGSQELNPTDARAVIGRTQDLVDALTSYQHHLIKTCDLGEF